MDAIRFRLDPEHLPELSAEESAALREQRDEDIDCSDIPAQPKEGWTRPGAWSPAEGRRRVILGLDHEVLAYFANEGQAREDRINAALREYIQSHRADL